MLNKKISYKDDLPVNAEILCIDDYPIHYHDDIECILVMEGSIDLKVGYYSCTLKQGEIFILNDIEIHSLKSTDKNNKVLMIHLDLRYFARYYKELVNCFFIAEANSGSKNSFEKLSHSMIGIMSEILNKSSGYKSRTLDYANELIRDMIAECQYFYIEKDRFVNAEMSESNAVMSERIHRIINYMYDNYKMNITLNDIAEREYLSSYYLSHIMKSATGATFQDLLCFIRVEQSEKLLLDTDKKISRISKEIGFSAVNYYKKHFIKWFGMSPDEYREAYKGKILSDANPISCSVLDNSDAKELIKKVSHLIDSDYDKIVPDKEIAVNVDLPADLQKESVNNIFASEVKDSSISDIILKQYHQVMDLNEFIIRSGYNYFIAVDDKEHMPIDHMTVFICNADQGILNILSTLDKETIKAVISNQKTSVEFTFNITGLSGEYVLRRAHMTKDAYAAGISSDLLTGKLSKRDHLLNQFDMTPAISSEIHSVNGTLNFRSFIYGFGSEIVFIDKV